MTHLMKYSILTFLLFFGGILSAQDTLKVQSFTYKSLTRDTMVTFPDNGSETYEKIIMRYAMRCHDGTVSSSGNNNGPHQGGCGEWDYSCSTYLTDSTRVDSLLTFTPSHVISGFNGSTYPYSNSKTYSYIKTIQKDVTVNSSTPQNSTVNSGVATLSDLLKTNEKAGKTQMLFSSAELLTAGLSAGDIYGLSVDVNTASSKANFLRVRMLNSIKTELDPNAVDMNDFTEVYYRNTNLVNGPNYLQFYQPFNWDGVSNVIVELSFTNNTPDVNTEFIGGDAGFTSTLTASDNSFTAFNGQEMQIPTTAFNTITDEITVGVWIYGDPSIMPANSYLFEGKDANNKRQINAHLPWSNSRVYWDCGSDGTNYDRIDKLANAEDFKGKWNHWAFTKNATTGEMKIYLNGALWHSGTGKTKLMNIETFSLGKSVTSSGIYNGFVDEFSVWNKVLDEATIKDWMNKSLDATHPNYASLVAYYPLNETSGNTSADLSPNAETANFVGSAVWRSNRGDRLARYFESSTMRPNVTFSQGIYDISSSDVEVLDSTENAQNIVSTKGINTNYGTLLDDEIIEVSSTAYWPAGIMNVTDEDGKVVDYKNFVADGTVSVGELEYFRRYPSKLELISFVTPYGNSLSLGNQGKWWYFDVTDFAPVLKGTKRMNVQWGGEWQEELDIQFLFIKGTPPREVKNIQQLWKVKSENYTNIQNGRGFEERILKLDPTATSYKLKSAITGHGQEGEFISRNHSFNINGGAIEFAWDVWKKCAENPVFPQGGTWIYDRAGWCPGMATDIKEFPLDGIVTPGAQISLRYDVASGSGDSRYIVSNQLVTYGPPNFTVDAGVVDIKRPTKDTEHGRFNPACNLPIVIIQNTGSANLTSLVISYNVKGGTVKTYNWTGDLKFLEKKEVVLPVDNISFWDSGTENVFEVAISNPNGTTDEYAPNNKFRSEFNNFARYTGNLEFELRTNNKAYENYYKLYDAAGNLVFEKNGFSPNTTYKEYLQLSPGCYSLEFRDTGEDGLYFWANSSQGTGYFRLRENNLTKFSFQPQFGNVFRYDFYSSGSVGQDEIDKNTALSVHPNPTNSKIFIEMKGFEGADVQVEIVNSVGQQVMQRNLQIGMNKETAEFDLSELVEGVYIVRVANGDQLRTYKVVKQ